MYDRCVVIELLLCDCYVRIMCVLCDYCDIIAWLLCDYDMVTM